VKQSLQILKLIGCAFGGAALVSLLLVILSFLLFGYRHIDQQIAFLSTFRLAAGLLGAVGGIWICLSSHN
jgi:hypothetical protein